MRPVGTFSAGVALKTHPTSIRLTDKLRESLKRLAKERKWTVSFLITQICEAWVNKQQR